MAKSKKAHHRAPGRADRTVFPTADLPLADWLVGFHAVEAALSVEPCRVQEIWLADSRSEQRTVALRQLAHQRQIAITECSRAELDQRVPEANHQGCIARCKPLAVLDEADLETLLDTLTHPPLILVLDGVQDPHNLGACLRTAEAAGVDVVVAPKDRASGLTPTAVKVASGSAERVPFAQITNLARVIQKLQQRGIWVVGTSGEAPTALYQQQLTGAIALVMGSEGKGLRRLTAELCDELIFIPMSGHVESLNVSVASGICLFEAKRQRSL